MKRIGLFEAKTKLSEICDRVAETREAVVITRRGQPVVRIEPVAPVRLTIKERRAEYLAGPGRHERRDKADFEPAPRSRETGRPVLED